MDQIKLFEQLSPTRLFFRCAIPSMVSMAVTALYTVADGIFVGRAIGSDALAAINLVMPFIMMSFALADMVAVGSSVQIATHLGAKNTPKANQIFTLACLIILGISLVVGAAAYPLADDLVRLIGADEELVGLAAEYMRVYAAFSPLIMIFFAVDNYLRICGRVRYSMWMNVAIALGNIVLDYVFLFVFRWGIWSAALASSLCLAAGTIICFIPFLAGRMTLCFTKPKWSARLVGNILGNGSSGFFSNVSASMYMVILNAVLMRLAGAVAVAAFSVVMYVDSILQSMLFGMYDSIQPAISYNHGAGNRKKVLAMVWRGMIGGCALSLAVMLWMLLGGSSIIGLFVKENDPQLLEMGVRAMKLFALSYLLRWFGLACESLFTALNRPVFSLLVSGGQTLVFPLALLAVLPTLLGLDGVWLTTVCSAIITTVLAAALLAVVLRSGVRSIGGTAPPSSSTKQPEEETPPRP